MYMFLAISSHFSTSSSLMFNFSTIFFHGSLFFDSLKYLIASSRLCLAIKFVKKLLLTCSWYSSGPITFLMTYPFPSSNSTLLAQNRAVSKIISRPHLFINSRSPETW
ncbi:107aa long hypothetical protein [Pyrococcus horikoshii OT3]|uniref:Uncharacterized protein n=1 Tax=Pyrococcus horikoshii (strain ATCC 700860 / DSM 12428 / JCM 9974 / NBRC 100139 / OT-3) TaxID=70601 RepID=O58514_PYRHO|nr:107aa long hypothetical protein [Pyrococcus horikoshii OT3]